MKILDDIYSYFHAASKFSTFNRERAYTQGVFCTTALRKEVFLKEGNKVTLNGRVKEFQWKNCGGGIWKATVLWEKSDEQ